MSSFSFRDPNTFETPGRAPTKGLLVPLILTPAYTKSCDLDFAST